MVIYDVELMKKSEKILNTLESVYSCCGDIICKEQCDDILNDDLKSKLPNIISLNYKERDVIRLVIYETLRLSKTKKK